MTFLPCRVCGNPVTGGTGPDIKSFCCSRSACIKKNTGVDTDEPSIIFNEKKMEIKN